MAALSVSWLQTQLHTGVLFVPRQRVGMALVVCLAPSQVQLCLHWEIRMSGSILPEAQHFKVLEINTQPQLRCFREFMEFVSLEAVANLCLPHQFLDNG